MKKRIKRAQEADNQAANAVEDGAAGKSFDQALISSAECVGEQLGNKKAGYLLFLRLLIKNMSQEDIDLDPELVEIQQKVLTGFYDEAVAMEDREPGD